MQRIFDTISRATLRNQSPTDASTGEAIPLYAGIRVHYRGTPQECYTSAPASAEVERASASGRVPPIQILVP